MLWSAVCTGTVPYLEKLTMWFEKVREKVREDVLEKQVTDISNVVV